MIEEKKGGRAWKWAFFCSLLILLLIFCNLSFGAVSIPVREVFHILLGKTPEKASWGIIVLQSRLPQTVTALLAGMSLSVSGLMLQTAFRNPLAGPDILGVNSGAGLGVAVVMLACGGSIGIKTLTLGHSISIILGALAGASLIMLLIMFISARVRSHVTLLIVGIMISYITSSVIQLLNFFSTSEGVHSYIMWGMGNFGGVSLAQLPHFCLATVPGLAIAFSLVKPLNAFLLGEYYAENLGINIKRVRTLLLFSTGLSVAVTTAFCGPVGFIGLAVPHLARLLLKSGNHRTLMPLTVLCGAATALLCNLISSLPGDKGLIPLNAITPIIGAPVIIYVLLRRR